MTNGAMPHHYAHYFQSVPGWFHFEECYRRLLEALPADKPSRWVELGCFQGRSTCWLGVEILNSGKPVTLYAVDSWVFPDPIQGRVIHNQFTENVSAIRLLLGDRFCVWPLPSLEAADCLADESCDVVFVDADHHYDAVSADISAWWAKLKPGGWMAGDDFLMEPVARAVVEHFAPSNYFLVHGWNYTETEQQGFWPSWMAQKV